MPNQFRDLSIGQHFVFLCEDDAGWSGARGPWIKTSSRFYRRASDQAGPYNVGTINARVRLAL